MCGGALCGDGGSVVRDEDIGLSYRGGGVVWRNATVFGGDKSVSELGISIVWGSDSAFFSEGDLA